MQPIFVVFHMDGTQLSNQAIPRMVKKMEDWSTTKRKTNELELHEAILITNSAPTSAFKKVRHIFTLSDMLLLDFANDCPIQHPGVPVR